MAERGIEVEFWGVRGSVPSPGADTALVGGNTSCVEIRFGDERLILDAGTGLRLLGDRIAQRKEHLATTTRILLSHVHWDHVMGLPFFAPLYAPGASIEIATGPTAAPLRDVLGRLMSSPCFPVDFTKLPSDVGCYDLGTRRRFSTGPFEVTVAPLSHPDPVYAYRIDVGGRAVVYATDTEHGEVVDERLVELARGADLLIYDAQYLPEEFPMKKGWGHSTYAAGAEIAAAAGVRTLALFHHDPARTDEAVSGIVKRAREVFPTAVAAREGMRLALDSETFGRHVVTPSAALSASPTPPHTAATI
jgi:phosphoribosyl 1,2-cyclic phosphodiesterase